MVKRSLVAVFLVFLVVVSGLPASAQYYGDRDQDLYGTGRGNLGVWGVDVVEQSPLIVPAVALEHRSRAPVLLRLRFYPLTLLTADNLEITHVTVSLDKSSKGVTSVGRYTEIEPEDDITSRDFTPEIAETKSEGVVKVYLDRYGVGRDRTPRISEDTVEKACQESGGKGVEDVVPDQIELSLKAVVRFKAKKSDGTYIDRRDFISGSVDATEYEIQERVEERLRQLNNRREQLGELPITGEKEIEKIEEDVRKQIEGGTQEYITDVVYFDTVIPIDKSRVYDPSPESLRKRICNTIDIREKLQGVIDKVRKVENVMTVSCLATMVGSYVSVLFGTSYCDATDAISLGCDWVFCPRSRCAEEKVDPFGSILSSSLLCWDRDRQFFGKSLLSVKEGVDEKGEDETKIECGYTNLDETTGKSPSAGLTIPHYGCISGVRGNLELIDLIVEKYQQCLVAAKNGGVSVGICDRLRNLYICDRAVGAFLDYMNSKGGSSIFTDSLINLQNMETGDAVPDKPGEVRSEWDEKKDTWAAVSKSLVDDYQRVPFFKMFANKEEYLRSQVCAVFIEGGFFDLDSFKNNMLTVPIPDSYLVYTEKRDWGGIGDEKSYSYDVFYQVYSGEEGYYGRGGNYNVYLRGTRIDMNGKKRQCSLPIASGYVPAGEMVQENVYKVDTCNAEQQCIRFKGRENCNDISLLTALTPQGADPFGLSLLYNDDRDGDGLPDSWESANNVDNPYDDADRDGYCNAMEFEKGTDPLDENSYPNVKGWKDDSSECISLVKTLKLRNEKGYEEDKEDFDSSQETEDIIEDIEEEEGDLLSLTLNSIKIKKDGVTFDDYQDSNLEIDSGGIYDVEFTFDRKIKNCNFVGDIYGDVVVDDTVCVLDDESFARRDSWLFTINIEPLDEGYNSFIKSYVLNNVETKVVNNNLLCEVTNGNNGEEFGYCLYADTDSEKRCSDYSIIGQTFYGSFIDQTSSKTACNNRCNEDYSGLCLTNDGDKLNDNVIEEV